MELKEFVEVFAEQFDDTPVEVFSEKTDYQSLDEWSSLTALSVIALVKESFDKKITGAEIRSCQTIEDLYNLIQTK
jgi:acyl carrier protein